MKKFDIMLGDKVVGTATDELFSTEITSKQTKGFSLDKLKSAGGLRTESLVVLDCQNCGTIYFRKGNQDNLCNNCGERMFN
jgi:hypothetical protein